MIFKISQHCNRNMACFRQGTVSLSTVMSHGYLLSFLVKKNVLFCLNSRGSNHSSEEDKLPSIKKTNSRLQEDKLPSSCEPSTATNKPNKKIMDECPKKKTEDALLTF